MELLVPFRKRASNDRALLRKGTYKDNSASIRVRTHFVRGMAYRVAEMHWVS